MLTPRQVELAREALGLRPSRMVTSSNVAVVTPGTLDALEWAFMETAGHAVFRRSGLSDRWVFNLTRQAAESVLLPGERLNPEDWP